MNQVKLIMSILFIVLTISARAQEVYSTDNLKIVQVAEHTFIHISYLKTEDFGNVACNGMVAIDQNEAIVYDTPTDDDTSRELINWVQNTLKSKITAVVATHFHSDCLGGLQAFHDKKIPSFANKLTIELAEKKGSVAPQTGFITHFEHAVGGTVVTSYFPGTGHTQDNIVAYFSKDQVLFGGCLIKSLGAGKGNLEDATPGKWPDTVRKLKAKYPDVKTVIPGHGKPGDLELLNYTIKKFQD